MRKNLIKWGILLLSFVMVLCCTGCANNSAILQTKAAEKKDVTNAQTSNRKLQKPVVDYATLKADKTEVTGGEKVKISVKITHDNDMESAYVYYMSGITRNLKMVELKYNESTKLYEGYIEISNSSESGTWKAESILTVDSKDRTRNIYNSVTVSDITLKPREDLSSGDFTVINTTPEYNPPTIEMSTLKVSQKTAKLGDKIKISIKITDETAIQRAMIFYTKPESQQSETIKLTYNKDTKMMEGYYEVTDTSESGEWKVNYIIAQDNNCNSVTLTSVWGNEEDLKCFANGDFVVEEIEEEF